MLLGSNREVAFFFYQDQAVSSSLLKIGFGDIYQGISKNDGITVLYKEQSLGWKFLLTLEINFFITLVFFLLSVSATLFLVENKIYGYIYCVTHFFSTYSYQIDIIPKTAAGKILNIIWMGCTLIFVTDFVAKLLTETDKIHYFGKFYIFDQYFVEQLQQYDIYKKIDLPITNDYTFLVLFSQGFNPKKFLPQTYTTDMIYEYFQTHLETTYLAMLDIDAMYLEIKDCTLHRVYINLCPLDLITPFQYNVSREEIRNYAAAQIDQFEVTLPKYWSESMYNQSDLAFETNLCSPHGLSDRYNIRDFRNLWVIYVICVGVGFLSKLTNIFIRKFYDLYYQKPSYSGLLARIEAKFIRSGKNSYKRILKYSSTLAIFMNATMRAKFLLKFEKNKKKLQQEKMKQNYKKILFESGKKKFLRASEHYDLRKFFTRIKNSNSKRSLTEIIFTYIRKYFAENIRSKLRLSHKVAQLMANSMLDYHKEMFKQKKKNKLYFYRLPYVREIFNKSEFFLFMMYQYRIGKIFDDCLGANYKHLRKVYSFNDYAAMINQLKIHRSALTKIVLLLRLIRNKNEFVSLNMFTDTETKKNNKLLKLGGVKKLPQWIPTVKKKSFIQFLQYLQGRIDFLNSF